MDPPARDRDPSRQHSVMGNMHGTCIRPSSGHEIRLSRDPMPGSQLLKPLHHSSMAHQGAVHHLDPSALSQRCGNRMPASGNIVRSCYVHRDPVIRDDPMGRRMGAAQSHFLLDRKNKVQIIGAVRRQLHGL